MSTDPEELFPPRAGGMVDTVRKQHAATQGRPHMPSLPLVEDTAGYEAVRVRDDAPELGVCRIWQLSSANEVAQILPRDDARQSAVIIAIDNDVYIGTNEGSVQDAAGGTTAFGPGIFYLPKGAVTAVLNKAPHWAACTTTGSVSRISVEISRYA